MRLFTAFSLAAALFAAENTFAADPAAAPQRKVAIIVENRAGAQFNDKVPVLEDLISSRIAGEGFSVISRDVTVNALKTYATAGVNVSSQSAVNANAAGASAQQAAAKGSAKLDADQVTASQQYADKSSGTASANVDVAQSDTVQVAATSGTTKLDRELSDNTSALRLAQNLGADFVLIPAITSFGSEKKTYNGNGISTVNTTYKLRLSYKIVEAGEGGALRGGTFESEKNIRDSGDLKTDSSDILNELLDDAADQLAAAIVAGGKSLPTEVAKAAMVSFNISCTMTDPRQQPILISAVSVSADNKLVATNQPVAVQPMDVTVELDGVALGSAPGEFKARPGLHKLRLSREGFSDWARTVNIYNGQTLRVAMQMSPEGYAKWKDTTDFLATLDANRKLTDAEVKRVEGIAEFYKNSHYRVDTKENVQIHKSLY
jgi:hypothetical protein